MQEKYHPSEGELEILQVLWQHEPATVRFVHEQLSKIKDVGYTTTLKQMQRLFEKGILKRSEEGKTHLYITTVREGEVQQTMFQRIVNNIFKGSAVDLALHALGNSNPSAEEIQELEELLQQMKKSKKDE
ncbi:MAG: BlaI/MecI/CopY family transcriptional regulator [Saprospiraceae bacterium]|nr:BlaI/MecI/CopY family transcriptional regulator [Saprospiraceae bacterium]